MNEFEDMVSGWKGQPVPTPKKNAKDIALIAKKMLYASRQKQVATIVVLGIVLVVIIAFALYTNGNNVLFAGGIGLMVTSLCIRIGIEWWSIGKMHHLDITKGTTEYLRKLSEFYHMRRKIHGAFTYVIFGLYVLGFCLLLPLFKQTMSDGFFTYILVSGAVTLVVLVVFIRRKIRQELRNLKEVKDELTSMIRNFENS